MRHILSFILGVTIVACGGADSTGLDGGSDSGGDSSGNDSGGDATMDAANNNDAADGAACPDESGSYTVTFTGQGCGNVATSAPICIQESSCTITLSTGAGGSNEISGTTPIVADGSFTGAALNEGSMNRTGCVGSWDAGTSTLTIDCGLMNTTQSCRATLVRKGANCN